MARIVPKLDLNRVPELVDNNSLIFAKNVRVYDNGIAPDLGINRVTLDSRIAETVDLTHFHIVGVIPDNNGFYIFLQSNFGNASEFIYYDELTNTTTRYNRLGWKYHGGKIDGQVVRTLRGDTVVVVTEYDVPGGELVPIKTFNLSWNDKPIRDESIYTQSPNIPILNLKFDGYYHNTIPAGTYQFFARFEIDKDYYTKWIPVSKELFAGKKCELITNQGELLYVDLNTDSDTSFKLVPEIVSHNWSFTKFQLGFIVARDNEVYARAYKTYRVPTNQNDAYIIYFDYDTSYIQEIDIKEFLEPIYSLYNVKNITSFRNKLYISNYIESDFNPSGSAVTNFIQGVTIGFNTKIPTVISTFRNRDAEYTTSYGQEYLIAYDNANGTSVSISDRCKAAINSINYCLNNVVVGEHNTFQDGIGVNINVRTLDTFRGQTISAFESTVYTDANGLIAGDISTLADYINGICARIYGINTTTGVITKNTSATSPGSLTPSGAWKAKLVGVNKPQNKIIEATIDLYIYTADLGNRSINTYDRSLIPHQGYDFYVHFVRANGEVTNGYKINPNPIVISDYSRTSANLPVSIYPTFTFTNALPEGYVAVFISITHVSNLALQTFNPERIDNTVTLDCLELDTQLSSALSEIPITVNNQDYLGDYKASGDSTSLLTFGASGKIVIKSFESDSHKTNILNNPYGFCIISYSKNERHIQLTKLTPYIYVNLADSDSYTFSSYNNLNLPGYICRVKKLNSGFTRYVSGDVIFNKINTFEDGRYNFNIIEHDQDITKRTREVDAGTPYDYSTYVRSKEHYIYSNYNLNYLSLSNRIDPKMVTVTHDRIEDGQTVTDKKRYTVFMENSSILSYIYELKSMYRDYNRRYYYPIDDESIIKFDNTIRSSILEGDEAKLNMFRFAITDYYNVPADKGIIINLVSSGNIILVHTEDSLYKFSGTNSLIANGGENIQFTEQEVFDTGVEEMFGSKYGYGGLRKKNHQNLSQIGYIYWDADCKQLYALVENKVDVISKTITRLIDAFNITDVHFASDFYNDRIFVCFHIDGTKYITLSFNYKTETFVSLHDFKFSKSFNTKRNCYFIADNNVSLYKVGNTIGTYPSPLLFVDTIYPHKNDFGYIIDIIYKDSYEVIKTCNAISWVCNLIGSFSSEITDANVQSQFVAEEAFDRKDKYKGDYLRLYTENTATDRFDISDRSNDNALTNESSYEKPRFNLGKWTFNYFRNILQGKANADAQSLIYGKYIVARFEFNRDKNFKIEDISFNIDTNYNV